MCRNFAALRDRAYPPEVLALLDQLGVDPRKEAEATHFWQVQPGRPGDLHIYGWFLHFVGRVVESPVPMPTPFGPPAVPVEGAFTIAFWEQRDLAHEAFRGLPLVQVDCMSHIPWVIEEEEPTWGERANPPLQPTKGVRRFASLFRWR